MGESVYKERNLKLLFNNEKAEVDYKPISLQKSNLRNTVTRALK